MGWLWGTHDAWAWRWQVRRPEVDGVCEGTRRTGSVQARVGTAKAGVGCGVASGLHGVGVVLGEVVRREPRIGGGTLPATAAVRMASCNDRRGGIVLTLLHNIRMLSGLPTDVREYNVFKSLRTRLQTVLKTLPLVEVCVKCRTSGAPAVTRRLFAGSVGRSASQAPLAVTECPTCSPRDPPARNRGPGSRARILHEVEPCLPARHRE